MKVNAYAKINWCLRILSRDDDGYHGIATLFQSVSLKDTLILKKIKNGFVFETDAEMIPKDSANLALKAVEVLCNNIKKIPSGLEILLEKNIPVEAGLGGGSADAAAVLRALNILWKLNLSEKRLLKLASFIGADVPFNIKGGLARAFNRGEKLKFYRCKKNVTSPLSLLIIKPNIGISTKWAYEEFDRLNIAGAIHESPLREITKLINAVQCGDFENIKKYAVNDFEKVIYPKYPRLEKIKNSLIKRGALLALLCGSGSATFGLFENKEKMEKAFKYFSENKNIKVYITKTVNSIKT